MDSGQTVCVLYGRESDGANGANVELPTSAAACGFVLWGVVTIILVLLMWIVVQVVMAGVGKPRM